MSRSTASARRLYGLNPSDIQNALYGAYGPSYASIIYSPISQYRVVMEVDKKYQAFSDYLSKIYFKTNTGVLVPLDSLAKIKEDVGPQSISHAGQLPAVTRLVQSQAGHLAWGA